jgi:KaiC/GvpD/RAD55 family RecA-like ATPase
VARTATKGIAKAPSGITGLDQITSGGLPRGRASLVTGGPGSGKTLFGMEFLLRGALEYGEPGVAMTFEETADEMTANLASLGYALPALVKAGKLVIDYVHIERREIEETGAYHLQGLFIRLERAINMYVAGTNLNSFRAIQNVRMLCGKVLPGRVALEVVDLYQQPRRWPSATTSLQFRP